MDGCGELIRSRLVFFGVVTKKFALGLRLRLEVRFEMKAGIRIFFVEFRLFVDCLLFVSLERGL